MPNEVLARAEVRLRAVLGISAVALGVGLLPELYSVIVARAASRADAVKIVTFGLAELALFACVVLLACLPQQSKRVVTVGRLLEIAMSYVLAVGGVLEESARYGHAPRLTWAIPLVMVFPLLVPDAPRAVFTTSALASTSTWIGVALAWTLGLLNPTPWVWVETGVPVLVAALIANYGAKLTRELSQAYAVAARAGKYLLREKLGEGGMGEVWHAEHEFLARAAAVKVIRPERLQLGPSVSELVRERFQREAKATALLRNPHTVSVYDYGVNEDGALFYVMELLEGLDLETVVLQGGPLPPERAASLLLQAARSLAEAHDNGVVHRDVKPSNLYLCHFGRTTDFVKVLDFGLAKFTRPDEQGGAELTREDAIQGTPAYMAPEQISSSKSVGPAADMYSLGCVGYFLLTGKNPFTGPSAVTVMLQHLSALATPPSHSSPARIPPAFDRLVLDCLAKDPARRPPNMDAFCARLSAIAFESPWTDARAAAWWHEHEDHASGARTIRDLAPQAMNGSCTQHLSG